jgi:hypothetical protein
MISDVDASLAAFLKAEALGGETEVVFEAPTTDWASRRSGPVVDVFLYEIREDTRYRNMVKPAGGRGGPGVRHFRLSYLLTAWTKRLDDEHRLLGQLLETLLEYDRIPPEYLRGRFRDEPATLGLAMPSVAGHAHIDLWNALGGQMKPSIDLVAVAPTSPRRRPVELAPEPAPEPESIPDDPAVG